MTRRMANCPACGGPIEFQLSTALVTVCDFCHSVVARTDKKLEDQGKVADLVETGSPVKRGMTGVFAKKSFEVVGQVQYQHPAGGVWDEWYLKFPNERVKWLAFAQGKLYVTSEVRLREDDHLPDFDTVSPGDEVPLPNGKMAVVAERATAIARSAGGEIPWAFRPDAQHRFVDLSTADGGFVTIEYDSASPRLFVGREVTLSELGISTDLWDAGAPAAPNTSALQLNCPQCAAPLSLHAPDQTLRVCCPSCKSLLDCQQGKLQYLQTLQMKRGEKILIPLGSVGTLFETSYTVIGFVERYVVDDGQKYGWSEYLLHSRDQGFRWLVRSKGHWSFVEPVPLSSLRVLSQRVIFEDEQFQLFDRGTAYVKYVIGEFYWRVTVGEQAQLSDYIAPPRMLSLEASTTDAGEELNVSLGTYVDKQVIERAFGLKELPAPWGVGAIQPAPKSDEIVFMIWPIIAIVLLLQDLVFSSGVLSKPVSQFHFFMALIAVSIWPIGLLISRATFESSRWHDSDFANQ